MMGVTEGALRPVFWRTRKFQETILGVGSQAGRKGYGIKSSRYRLF